MAKVSKPQRREPSIHSRAHRRNASPPPKDLAVQAPAESSDYKPWLHNAQNAGISKKKKTKQLSRQQKLRQQRAVEKADANLDKLATKVKDSKARGRKVQARRVEWEELNEKGAGVVEGAKVAHGEDAGEGGNGSQEEEEEEDGLDVGMNEARDVGAGAKKRDGDVAEVASSPRQRQPEPEEDEEL